MNRSNLIIFLLFLPNFLAQDEFLPDEECESLNSEALREKIREGLCKPIQFGREEPSTTTTQKPVRHLLSANDKRRLMKIIYFGNQKYLNVTLNTEDKENIQLLEVVEGTFLELQCNTNDTLDNETISPPTFPKWFVNGKEIAEHLGWRIQLYDNNSKLVFSPTMRDLDGGLYECVLNGETVGWMRMQVYALWDSILDGFINYIVVILVGSPIFFMITACQAFAKGKNSIQNDPLFIGEDPEKEEDYEELMMQIKDAELYH